jgi:DNA topoisomerase-1
MAKPRTASLFKSMTPESVTSEEALRLLTLPRTVGESEGEEVGGERPLRPYVKKGRESRSLDARINLHDHAR